MEYSIWQNNLTSKVNPKALHMTLKNYHMEYSIWLEIVTTWSTPWGLYFLPHGVLHMENLELTFYPLDSKLITLLTISNHRGGLFTEGLFVEGFFAIGLLGRGLFPGKLF